MEKEDLEIVRHISGGVDRIITILEKMASPPSLAEKVASGAATGVGILGILSAIDIIKSWLGG